jgi:RNA polymerase sigma factor (sigma-70 family)
VLDAAILQQAGNVPPRPIAAQDSERTALILAHRHLCGRGARRFLRPGFERGDLEQVASFALVKASDRFDPRRRAPFEAYAWLMIRSELGHHVRAQEHLVRPPRRLRDLERRYAAMWEKMSARLGREPREHEIASALEIPHQALAELQSFRKRNHRQALQDRDVAVPAVSLDERLALKEALRALSSLERQVIFGIYWLESRSAGLGRRLGLSSRSVAEIHRGALSRLRQLLSPGSDSAR